MKVVLPRSSYAGSVTAAFFVILIVYLAKNDLVQRMIHWIRSAPASSSTPAMTPATSQGQASAPGGSAGATSGTVPQQISMGQLPCYTNGKVVSYVTVNQECPPGTSNNPFA